MKKELSLTSGSVERIYEALHRVTMMHDLTTKVQTAGATVLSTESRAATFEEGKQAVIELIRNAHVCHRCDLDVVSNDDGTFELVYWLGRWLGCTEYYKDWGNRRLKLSLKLEWTEAAED